MKIPLALIILFAFVSAAVADLPVKPPLARYSALWNNSPFTAKPPPQEAGPEENILDDYSLIGVSSIGGNGHRVTLINKKKPDDRITVDSDNPKSDFKILSVTRKPGNPLGTVVSMMAGSMKGTVSFDESLLTLAAAAPPRAPNQPQMPPNGIVPNPNIPPNNPNMPPGSQLPPGTRLPRPRVVPPPIPQNAGQPQPQPTPQPMRPTRHGN